jgi:hypothetical protein
MQTTPPQQNTLTQDNRGSSWTPVVIIILLLVVAGLAFLLSNQTKNQTPEKATATSSDTIPRAWNIYENRRFGFRIRYPTEGWTISKSPNHELTPRFSIHKDKKDTELLEEPLDHHATGTYVGIYPHGIPTEGVMGEYGTTTKIDFDPQVKAVKSYTLADESVWGTYAQFHDAPSVWESHGFVWGQAAIQNRNTYCTKNGQQVPARTCDVMLGDTLIREGDLNSRDQATVAKILASFTFIQPTATTTTPTSSDAVNNQ